MNSNPDKGDREPLHARTSGLHETTCDSFVSIADDTRVYEAQNTDHPDVEASGGLDTGHGSEEGMNYDEHLELDTRTENHKTWTRGFETLDNLQGTGGGKTRSTVERLTQWCCHVDRGCLFADKEGWRRAYSLIRVGLGSPTKLTDEGLPGGSYGSFDSREDSLSSKQSSEEFSQTEGGDSFSVKWRWAIAAFAIVLQVVSAYTGFKAGIQSGPVLQTLSDQQFGKFSKEITIMAVLYLVNSFSLIFSAFIGERLRIEWRHAVLNKIHHLYFGSAVPYWLNGGAKGIKSNRGATQEGFVRKDDSIDTVDQRITQDLDSFTQYCSQLLFGLFDDPYSASSTLVSLILSVTFVSHIGWFPVALASGFFLLALTVVSLLTPRVSNATRRVARSMGNLRFVLARVLEHAESILFWGGQLFENEKLDRILRVTYLKYIALYFWQFVLSSWTSFQGSFPEILGLIATATVYSSVSSENHSVSDIAQSVASIRALAAAMCFLPSVLSKAGLIFGYAHRVGALIEILKSQTRGGRKRSLRPVNNAEQHTGAEDTNTNSKGDEDETLVDDIGTLLRVSGLSLSVGTDGNTSIKIGPVDFRVARYQHTLIEGPSGCGKSTLLRAIAGLVPSTSNCIRFSTNAQRENHVFLSQKVYLPAHLSLRDLVLYPYQAKEKATETRSEALNNEEKPVNTSSLEEPLHERCVSAHSLKTPGDPEILYILYALGFERLLAPIIMKTPKEEAVLTEYVPVWAPWSLWSHIGEHCGMSFSEFLRYLPDERTMANFLDSRRSWNTILSVGEQQRLLLARLLWQRPTIAFLDEATSAMNTSMEAHCIELLKTADITLVSVGHSVSLREVHNQVVQMEVHSDSRDGIHVECKVSPIAPVAHTVRMPADSGFSTPQRNGHYAVDEDSGSRTEHCSRNYTVFGKEFWMKIGPLLSILFQGEKWKTMSVLLLAVGINVTLAFVTVKNAVLPGTIFEAINEKRWDDAWKLITLAFLIYALASILGAAARSVGSAITAIWYRKIVAIVMRNLFNGTALLEATSPVKGLTSALSTDDNRSVDQRVLADTFEMTSTVGTILFGARGRISLLQVIFTCITLSIKASSYGWMPLFLCLLYTLLTSAIVGWLVLPIAHWVYTRNTWEGRFRTVHTTIREYSEQIAFYFGERREYYAAENTFSSLKRVYLQLINAEFWPVLVDKVSALSGTTAAYGFLAVAVLATSGLGSKSVTAGAITSATGVLVSLNLYLGSLPDYLTHIAETSGLVYRVSELMEGIEKSNSFRSIKERGNMGSTLVKVDDIVCKTPQGQRILQNINFSVHQHRPLWIRGATGCGKSSLLRILSGLWDCVNGKIIWNDKILLPEKKVVFVPQKPYTFQGSFRENLLYPKLTGLEPPPRLTCGQKMLDVGPMGPDEVYSRSYQEETQELVHTLEMVCLEPYTDRLDEVADWPNHLSLGEQQRIAFARVLLQKPELVFLDEATSAMDGRTEKICMQCLCNSGISFVSIGHRPSLGSFHMDEIVLG